MATLKMSTKKSSDIKDAAIYIAMPNKDAQAVFLLIPLFLILSLITTLCITHHPVWLLGTCANAYPHA